MFKDKKLYLFLGVVVLFFGFLYRINFSVDTYLLFASPNYSYVREYLGAGRIFTWLLFYVMGLIKIPHIVMYLVSYILGIVLLTIAIYELNKILDKYIDNKFLSILISISILINPFIIELWLFIESGIMMLSILGCVEAFKYFDKYLEKKNKKNLLYSFIWMLVAAFSYQGTLALFIALSIFSVLYRSKKFTDFIVNNVIMGLIYGLPTLGNYILIRLFSNNRVGGSFNISNTISNIIHSTKIIIGGFGLVFRGAITILLVASITLVIYYILKSKSKKKGISILSVIYIILMIYIFTILPIIPQTGERIAVYPRTCYAFFSMIGVLFLFANKKANYKGFMLILLVLLGMEFLSFTRIEGNRYRVNQLDREIILEIEDKVKEYEKDTGITVSKLAIYNLKDSAKFYDRLDDRLNVSAIKERPSGLAAYTFFARRRLEYTKEDKEVYEQFFKNIDDDEFDINQVIIIDDTIHWYLY